MSHIASTCGREVSDTATSSPRNARPRRSSNASRNGRNVTGGITFHNTRHSFTTRLIAVTDLATARSFTGHSDSQMVAYYSHATADSQRAAMEALYGGNDLREIYDAVRDGKMTFAEFKEVVRLR